jgi:hypothetical protein
VDRPRRRAIGGGALLRPSVLLGTDTRWHHCGVRTQVHVYEPAERPDVEVLVDGQWLAGEARMRWFEDGAWWWNVQWRPAGTQTRRLDGFREERVRRV